MVETRDVASAGNAGEAVERVDWLMGGAAEAAMLTDPAGRIVYVNAAFIEMTGYGRDEVLGRTPALMKSGEQPAQFYRDLWRVVCDGREFRGLLVNRRKNGELFHEEKAIRPLFDAAGRITHFLSCGRDVSDRVAALARLHRAATHDALTGLPNRLLLLERLGAAIARVRDGGAGFTLALVDIDDFKRVNDEHGHAIGDAVLQGVARRLQQGVRKADTVARLGGDEFALLLEGSCDEADASQVLRAIVDTFAAAPRPGHEGPRARVSIGACVDRAGLLGMPRLLELADRAMYEVKRDGGRGFRVCVADAAKVLVEQTPVQALRGLDTAGCGSGERSLRIRSDAPWPTAAETVLPSAQKGVGHGSMAYR